MTAGKEMEGLFLQAWRREEGKAKCRSILDVSCGVRAVPSFLSVGTHVTLS